MKKGFLATAVLLSCLSLLYYSTLLQANTINSMRQTKNYIKKHQETQENKYRLTQGFKETVKQTLKEDMDKKPIEKELSICGNLQSWIKSLENEGKNVEMKAGYLNPYNYHYKEDSTKAFDFITGILREDPAQALGALKSNSTRCINYISVNNGLNTATVKENGYLKKPKIGLTGEPSFVIEIDKPKSTQKVIIPSGTVIR